MSPNDVLFDTLITEKWFTCIGLTGFSKWRISVYYSCSEHFLNNYVERKTIKSYTLLNLIPKTWSKHQFISDSRGGLQLRHTAIGSVHFRSSSSFISYVWRAIWTKPNHIWGNYKSQWWPRILVAHQTNVKLLWIWTLCCNMMWLLAPMTGSMNGSLSHTSWPRWGGAETVFKHRQHTVKHFKNTNQDRKLENSQEG